MVMTSSGLVSLLNDARHAKNMKPMGFLNPFLYQNPTAFTDIVQGTNAIGRDGIKVWKRSTYVNSRGHCCGALSLSPLLYGEESKHPQQRPLSLSLYHGRSLCFMDIMLTTTVRRHSDDSFR